MGDNSDEPRQLVSTGCRVLAANGQGDLVWGHLSMRDPDGRGVWMKRSTIGFDEVGPDDVLLVDRDGSVLEGEGRQHAEFPIHTEIMAARDDVGAVAHTHAPNAVAFASLGVPLRPVSHEATLFTPPGVARYTASGDLILTRELGNDVAVVLGDNTAVFLVNHGIAVAGTDVPSAVVATILLERACAIQLRAMSAGDIRHFSDEAEAISKRANCYSPALLHQAWEYVVRGLSD